MRYFRTPYQFVLVVLLLFVAGSCKKAEPSPLGSLKINVTYSGSYSNSYLYTEIGWAGPRTASPLRQYKLVRTSSTGQQQTIVSFTDLNPGNYVFSLDGSQGQSVQVIADQEGPYFFNL